jgi:hypothetical protein
MLIKFGADVNIQCGTMGTPLTAALQRGCTGITTLLRDNGAKDGNAIEVPLLEWYEAGTQY